MKITYSMIILIFTCGALAFSQGSAFLLDTHLTYIPAPNGQEYPTIAFDGTSYFVAWIDWRNTLSYHYDYSSYGNIYGCRITPDGILLDSAGIQIAPYVHIAGYVPYAPSIAYGAGVFLFVWKDYRDFLVHAARIDTNGIVLDPGGFVIAGNSPRQDFPSVAFDGENFLVVWLDWRAYDTGMERTSGIYGCRVSPEGTLLDPGGKLIRESGELFSVSIAFGIKDYFVVWSTWDDINGIRVDTLGDALDTITIPICTLSNYLPPAAKVCFGGNYYFVAWDDKRSSPDGDIYGARVDTGGIVLDTNGFAISTLPEYESSPYVTFGGTNYLVTWKRYCARIETTGVVLDTMPVVFNEELHSAAFDGTNFFITMQSDEIYGTRVETSGVVIDTNSIVLSWSAYPGHSSSAAFNDTNYFVVWTDFRDTAATYIYGTRIDTLGTILDPSGIPIIQGSGGAIAFDGRNYLVAYNGVKGALIDNLGSIIDTLTIFAEGGSPVSILFDSTKYFMVWSYGWCIYGARVSTRGVLLDPEAILIGDHEYSDETNPAVSFDGTNYFVVWESGNDITPYHVYGARVKTSGVLIDTTPISIATDPYNNQRFPAISFDGTNYFVVWQDNRNDYADIYGARITKNGVVLNPSGIPICTAPSAQYKPEIRFDGHNYCVIWEDWRNGEYTDIYGCYITTAGVVTQEFVVSDQPNLQLEPNLVKGPDKFLVTCTGFVDSLNGRPANTMRIWAKFQEFVGIEESSADPQYHAFQLFPNYPNPFSQTTTIKFQIPSAVIGDDAQVSLKIYDATGSLVRQFNRLHVESDNHIDWSGDDDSGKRLPAGIYFIQLTTPYKRVTEKAILLR